MRADTTFPALRSIRNPPNPKLFKNPYLRKHATRIAVQHQLDAFSDLLIAYLLIDPIDIRRSE